jgi:hypothetical protein
MSVETARPRIDLDALRKVVSIPHVLERSGVPFTGRRGRCPIHGGDNPTAFSVSDDGQLFHCFVCGAGGDVFELVKRLDGCDFALAVAVVTEFSGYTPGTAPKLTAAEVQRRTEVARRRAALKRWRNARLVQLGDAIRVLTDDAEWLGQQLCQARARGQGEAVEQLWWWQLEQTHTQLAVAEWLTVQLEDANEPEWLRLWIEERTKSQWGQSCTTA